MRGVKKGGGDEMREARERKRIAMGEKERQGERFVCDWREERMNVE